MDASTAYAVILAAGRGTRFGGAKLLASLWNRPVADYSAAAVRKAVEEGVLGGAVAVIAPGDVRLRAIFEQREIEVALNPTPDAGLSSSLKAGLARLAERRAHAALIVLADQPLLDPATIAVLVGAWRKGAGTIVRPRYRESPGVPGHPVLIDHRHWGLAGRLSGDVGLNAILGEAQASVLTIEVPRANPDINTESDLLSLS